MSLWHLSSWLYCVLQASIICRAEIGPIGGPWELWQRTVSKGTNVIIIAKWVFRLGLCANFLCSQKFSANFQQLVHSIWTITPVFKRQMLKTWLDNYISIYFPKNGTYRKTAYWQSFYIRATVHRKKQFIIMSVMQLWEQNQVIPEEQFSQSSSKL